MAYMWEFLVGNLNLGLTYLFTTITQNGRNLKEWPLYILWYLSNPPTGSRKIITNLCLLIQYHKLNFIKTLIIWQSCFFKASGSTSFVKTFNWSQDWIRSFSQGWNIDITIIILILAGIRIIGIRIWILFFI